PEHFDFGDLRAYYLGAGVRQRPDAGSAWLLGCTCGEVGCWPLSARVSAGEDRVEWAGFSQPHRPDWVYEDLGVFAFERHQYERAVSTAIEEHDALVEVS